MATHELYLGGPASANVSRAMFPAPTFAAGSAPFATMRAAAHKGPACYALNRVLDFRDDHALKHFVANNTVAQADVLGALVIPPKHLLLGMYWEVERAAGVALTMTPDLRVAAGAFPVIDCNVLDGGWAAPGVAADIQVTGTAASIVPWYMETAEMLDLALTSWTSFGVLRLNVTAVVIELKSGQP